MNKLRFAYGLATSLVALAAVSLQVSAALVGYWKFDESTGLVASDEASGNNGIWVPGADARPDWRPSGGLIGGAIKFPGTGNHVNHFVIGGFPELIGTPRGMTISVWLKPASDSGYRGILMTRTVTDGAGSGRNYGLGHDDDGADARVSGASVDSVSGSLVASGTWVHVAWVWDNVAGTQRVYLDGVQSGPTASPGVKTIAANGEWRIGDDACCRNRTLDGMMDDLAVWDTPLSSAEIAQIHTNGLAGLGVGDDAPPLPGTDPLDAGLVINEVHYDPMPETNFVEFFELLNTGPDTLDLSRWRVSDGVTFEFPPGTMLGVTEHLLLAEDPTALAARFAIPPGTQIFSYRGALSNDGERIELRDASGLVIDTVDYRAEFPWPIAPNGEGASMQLLNATLDNDLGGSWRAASPTPGRPNAVFTTNAPPVIRQVIHVPESPASASPIRVTAKITDQDGVVSARLLYQIVPAGSFLPAFLPNPYATLTGNPSAPQSPNPAFEDPANWSEIAMTTDGSGIFAAQIPAQPNRTLVRYRIEAGDALAASVRVPYPDDPSLNFACFVYDGVPTWNGFSPGTLTALPVYFMVARDSDRRQAYAYSATGDGGWQIPKGNVAARRVYNWECALVYDGEVYDHVSWRLRQQNDRYAGNGKRSMRFRLNRGRYFQARSEDGAKLPVKWRRMNTSKMSRFGGTNSYGLHETMNSKLWRMVSVEAPYFLPVHWRMVDGADEAPDAYNGDFFGLATVVQDIDGRLLDERGLPDGNIYKLKDGVTNSLDLRRNRGRLAVQDGGDFLNIRNNLNAGQSDAWLRDHVDWEQWMRYHAVVEAVRHYDYGVTPVSFKNRAWYFSPDPATPFGRLRLIPHDHDATWAKGYHDNLNVEGWAVGTGYPWGAIFGSTVRPVTGPEKTELTRDYRNFIREFRQLLWQEETVHALIDDHAALLEEFALADRARWTSGPSAAGVESMTTLAGIVTGMKSIAFENDTMYGTNLVGGRAAFLNQIAADPAIPDQPTIVYTGAPGFPAGAIEFSASAFSDPQGPQTFASRQWRIAETVIPSGEALETVLVSEGDDWKYFDLGTDPGVGWNNSGFDDSAWPSGSTQIGYGETDQSTIVQGRNAATLFRKSFVLADGGEFVGFAAGVVRDDGVVVYLNGTEIFRDRMPEGAISYQSLATGPARGADESAFQTFTIAPDLFVDGVNILAISVHQNNPLSSDMSFDFYLNAQGDRPQQKFEWAVDWETSNQSDSIILPAAATRPGRTYRARVRQQDTTGRRSLWSEPVEFVASQPDVSLFAESLVISEIMYHPTDPTPAEIAAGFTDDSLFEYIEVRNVGSEPVDLSNIRFTKGIDYDFIGGTLAPGAFILVAANVAAFKMRYGTVHPVAGAWSGKLNNAGEQLKLSFGAGEPIRDFAYDDASPWPTAPDGGGASLALVDPFSLPDHGDPFNWRPGATTPGSTDGTVFSGGDFLAYATGPSSMTALSDGQFAFAIEVNRLAEDVSAGIQTSANLVDWQPADLVRSSVEVTTAGRARITFTGSFPVGEGRWFIRYAVGQR